MLDTPGQHRDCDRSSSARKEGWLPEGKRSAVRRKERRLLKEKKVGRRRKRRTAVGRKSSCAEPGEKLSINDISN